MLLNILGCEVLALVWMLQPSISDHSYSDCSLSGSQFSPVVTSSFPPLLPPLPSPIISRPRLSQYSASPGPPLTITTSPLSSPHNVFYLRQPPVHQENISKLYCYGWLSLVTFNIIRLNVCVQFSLCWILLIPLCSESAMVINTTDVMIKQESN